MLAARARRAVGVDPEVLLVDLDVDVVVDQRGDLDRAKDVCRRWAESNGESRTSRWTPFSAGNAVGVLAARP